MKQGAEIFEGWTVQCADCGTDVVLLPVTFLDNTPCEQCGNRSRFQTEKASVVFVFRFSLNNCLGKIFGSVSAFFVLLALAFGRPSPLEEPWVWAGAIFLLAFLFFETRQTPRWIRFEDRVIVEYGFGRERTFEFEELVQLHPQRIEFESGVVRFSSIVNSSELVRSFHWLIELGKIPEPTRATSEAHAEESAPGVSTLPWIWQRPA